MKAERNLEVFARSVHDSDNRMPNSRSRCIDIGMWGGCGVVCAAFVDGECEEPQEISKQEIIDEHGEEDAQIIFNKYDCFRES